jgi:hypothetical protein
MNRATLVSLSFVAALSLTGCGMGSTASPTTVTPVIANRLLHYGTQRQPALGSNI